MTSQETQGLREALMALLDSDDVERGFTCNCQLNIERLADQLLALLEERGIPPQTDEEGHARTGDVESQPLGPCFRVNGKESHS